MQLNLVNIFKACYLMEDQHKKQLEKLNCFQKVVGSKLLKLDNLEWFKVWWWSSKCDDDHHLLNEQQRPQFTPSVSESPTAVHESLNAGEYSHLPTGEEEASRRNYSRRNYRLLLIVKMEIKEEPCRIKDEDTEEQIG